jgi:hypothetical protein
MPKPNQTPDESMVGRSGIPVDYAGAPTVDPTKNVLDLVRAESKYQDAMRDALNDYQNGMRESQKEFQNFARDTQATFQNQMRDAETRRLDELATTSRIFQDTIRNMLAESVRTTSDLVSNQLVQIQATFNERVSKLEAGAFMAAGKSSVADPALADAMTRITNGIAALGASTTETLMKMQTSNAEAWQKLSANIATVGTKELQTKSERMGQGQVIAWIIGAAMLMAAIATPLIAFLALRPPHP